MDKENVNASKPALVLLPLMSEELSYTVFLYKPKPKKKASKPKIIYGIRTADSESSWSIKAYCSTYNIALREVKKYYDWWSDVPANEKNIVPIEVIIE